MSILYIGHTVRYRILPVIILVGGIYIILDFRCTELGFILSFAGVISLTYQAAYNRPIFSKYVKNPDDFYNRVKTELGEKKSISANYLQQKYSLNLTEAAEILDRLKKDGLII